MKPYLIIMIAAALVLSACEQKEGQPHERTELPAADIKDSVNQDNYLRTEDLPEDVSDNVLDLLDQRPNEKTLDAAEDTYDVYDEGKPPTPPSN